MSRVVGLLRGVNIGKRRVSMPVLRRGLSDAGWGEVATYVQSGNVVVAPPWPVTGDVAAALGAAISEIAGFEVSVVLRTADDLDRVIAANPYPAAGGTELHVVFFAREPGDAVVSGIDLDAFAPEHGTLLGRELYLHLPGGMGRAKLPVALDKQARRDRSVLSTTRNWNTVQKLAELARP